MERLRSFGLLSCLFLLVACGNSEDDIVGKWDDNIKLSQKEVSVSGESNAIDITTEGTGWWIAEIFLDNKNYDLSETNTIAEDFVISKEEFSISRTDAKKLHIEIFANTTGEDRVLKIFLQNGDYFDSISIRQARD